MQNTSIICKFKFLCDKQWGDLNEIADQPNVRYCGGCQKSVFLCRNYDSLEKHIAALHCVAVESVEFDDEFTLGYPSAPAQSSYSPHDLDDDLPL